MLNTLIIGQDKPYSDYILNTLRCLNANLFHCIACTEQINDCLNEHSIDIVFFDADLNNHDIRMVAERLRLQHPFVGIVFLATCPGFAFQAFEMNAIDYLVQPCSEERFRRCIQKIYLYLQHRNKESLHTTASLLSIKTDNVIHLLNQKEIAYINAEGRSSKLIIGTTAKKAFVVSESLKSIEQRIDSGMFIRTHRSYIINLNHIRKIEASGQTNLVFFRSCPDIAYLSKNYALSLYEKLNLR